eukprot:5139425-Amphidinium_carterae.1
MMKASQQGSLVASFIVVAPVLSDKGIIRWLLLLRQEAAAATAGVEEAALQSVSALLAFIPIPRLVQDLSVSTGLIEPVPRNPSTCASMAVP